MGAYTPTLKLYKPDSTEFVDVDAQVNNNWDIADAAVRGLLEYQYTDLAVPDTSNVIDHTRFFKPYSNCVNMWYGPPNNFFYQDPTAFVSTWVSAKSLLQPGWLEHPDFPLCYRIVKKASGATTTLIEWTGAVITQYPPVTIDPNVNTFVVDVNGMPSTIKPVVSKYFDVWAGNTGTNFSIARLFFSSGGSIEIKRYGDNPANPSDENRIEFTGIKYNLEVAA